MQNLQLVKESFKNNDWFYDISVDELNRPVIYVHYMNSQVFQAIAQQCSNLLPVKPCIHFAGSILLDKSKIVNVISAQEQVDLSSDNLLDELDRLGKICDVNTLSSIFYEIHDGKNAITDYSIKFPEVRQSLDKLYIDYGFDVLYEELDS